MNTVQSAPAQNDAEARKNNRLWVLAFSALSVLTVVLCAWTFSGLKNSNSIYTPQTTHNFGSVQEGAPLHCTFLVRNLHPWPITITGVGATCGCTTAFIRPGFTDRLLPLQSTPIDVSLDTSGDRGAIQEGVIISVNGNNRYNLLYIKATVRPKSRTRKEHI